MRKTAKHIMKQITGQSARKGKTVLKKIAVWIGVFFCLCGGETALAETWEFGSSGSGLYPFLPKGYMIVTDSGEYWLSSRFENSVGGILYGGTLNGLSYIDAAEAAEYRMYALTDRNPKEYRYLAAYKNGVRIEDFEAYIGAPGRVEEEGYMGSNANWRIPIIGFPFEPGVRYEFAFLRGLQANNGITLVLSEDDLGYLDDPRTPEEIAWYEAEKDKEYEFITSYWKIEDEDSDDYTWGYNLVPMRFSVQTYADLGSWRKAADEANAFLDSVTPEDISGGIFLQSNLDNLRLLIEYQAGEADRLVKMKLQPEAEELMVDMVADLYLSLEQAKLSEEIIADTSVLEETLVDAKILYEKASANIGGEIGQYNAGRVEGLKAAIDYAETLTPTSPQVEINQAVKDLRNAMVLLSNSQRKEPMDILVDEASGISALIPQNSVPADTALFADTVKENIPQAEELIEYMGNRFEHLESVFLYDIRLSAGGDTQQREIQPSEGMQLQIPEGSDIADKSVAVYRAGEDEPLRLSSVRSGGYRIFETDQGGVFVFAVRSSTAGAPPLPEGTPQDTPDVTEVILTEETEAETEEAPPQIEEELVTAPGPIEELEDFNYGAEWARHDVLDSVDISVKELRREGYPAPLIALAIFLLILAIGIQLPVLISYIRQKHR